jgi:radical SAM protein with 4Fe4S-binding SPASM domain
MATASETKGNIGVGAERRLYQHQAPILPAHFEPRPDARLRLSEMDLYVTMKCNLDCEFCSVCAGAYSHQDLPTDRICRLLDEARELGLRETLLIGGEPTLRKDLEVIIRHAANLGIFIRLVTNGMVATRRRIERFQECGLKEVVVSIDGLEATHNRLRGCAPDGWRRSLQFVETAAALGLRVRVTSAAFQDNVKEVVQVMRLAESLGAFGYSVLMGSPLGRGRSMANRVLSPYEWRDLEETLTSAAQELREGFYVVMEKGYDWRGGPPIDRSNLKGNGTGCNALLDDFDYIIVRSDGNIYQCIFFLTEGAPIANIREQPLRESLLHALEVAKYKPFTQPQDKCRSCSFQVECGTGCRGYAHLYKNDWLKTDPRCVAEAGQTSPPEYFPLCPMIKSNVRSGRFGGSTEQAIFPPKSSATQL